LADKTSAVPEDEAATNRRAQVASLLASQGVDGVLTLVETLVSERDSLSHERDALSHKYDSLSNKCDALTAEYDRQELRIKQLQLLLYGRRTEKLTSEELGQLALAFGADEAEAAKPDPQVPHPEAPDASEDDSEQEGAADEEKKKKKRKRRKRTIVGPEVERSIEDVLVPAEERACTCCHHEMQVIDLIERSWLEFVPAKFIQHIERREKLACRRSECRGDIHAAGPAESRPERRKVDASLLTQLVEGKCHDALPIDRQRDQFARMGVTFPLNTLYSYWTYVTTLLLPVAKIVLARVLAAPIVGVDDTKLRVLNKGSPGGSYKACLWCFTTSGPLVAFTVTRSWEAKEIAEHIGVIDGFIQCDDYKGYGSVVAVPDGKERVLVDPERRLGCMMHVRRHFYDALKLGDKRAAPAIEWIGLIYEVEAEAKAQGLDAAGRLALRNERSVPLLDELEAWIDKTKPKCTPKSPLAKALGYAEQQRPFIRRCFSDGRFEIDNGHTERAIRRPCVGRNNYLFTGSPDAAERLAGAYTLVLSGRNVGIDIRTYLADVIRKLEAGWPMRRIAELVPDQWAVLHGPGATPKQSPQ
jgi:transposase